MIEKIKINTNISNTYKNVFFTELVDVVFHENYEDVYKDDGIIMVSMEEIHKLLGLQDMVISFLQRNVNNIVIFINIYESFTTIRLFDRHFKNYNLSDFVANKQIKLITSGNYDDTIIGYCNCNFFEYGVGENTVNVMVSIKNFENIYAKTKKPYKFLFLNGQIRTYREKFYKILDSKNLLDSTLWSYIKLNKFLPSNYPDFFNTENFNIAVHKDSIEKSSWNDGRINPVLYTDTYFSVVTETNIEMPHTFITEKTYKPILAGHPFIIVANAGFYKDLHNLGYKTFSELIDESFDEIEDNDARISRIADIVEELCNQDLNKFLQKARPICEYNQQLFLERVGKYYLTRYNLVNEFTRKHLM